MNDHLPNSFLLLNIFFFSLCSFTIIFIILHVSERDNHDLQKKMRENIFENMSKNTLHIGPFHLDKRSTKQTSMTKKSCRAW